MVEGSRKRAEGSSKRWLVLLSCAILQAMMNGLMFAFGRLLIDIMVTFNATRAEASLVQSFIAGVGRGGGIFWGMTVSRLGPRNAGLITASVSTAALLASYFAKSLFHLVISAGIVSSAAISTLMMCTLVATGQHFSRETNTMALTILTAASGTGAIIHSYFLGYLSDTYGLRGTFLILAGFSFNGVAFAWLWTSPENHKQKTVTDNSEMATLVEHSPNEDREHFEHKPTDTESIANMVSNNGSVVTKPETTKPESLTTFKEKVNISVKDIKAEGPLKETVLGRLKAVLINHHFMIFCAGSAIGSPCIQLMMVFLVDILVGKGFNESQASLVFILFNTCNLFGRLCTGIIMKIPRMTAFSVPLIAFLLAMVVLWSLDFVQSFPLISILCCIGGVASGMFAAMVTVCTVELVGVKYLPEGVGLVRTTFGISMTLAGPIAGSLRDVTGSYTTALLAAAVAASIAFLTFLAGKCYKKPSTASTV